MEAARRGATASDGLAPFRGLVVSDAEAARLLMTPTAAGGGDGEGAASDRGRQRVADAEAALAARRARPENRDLPIATMVRRFNLDSVERLAIVACFAVEYDPRYEKLFGYLHDDITRRRPSPDLVLDLAGLTGSARLAAMRAFAADGPLFRSGLVRAAEVDRPFAGRALAIDADLISFIAGHRRPPAGATDLCPGEPSAATRARAGACLGIEDFARLEAWLEDRGAGDGARDRGGLADDRPPVVVISGPAGSGRRTVASALWTPTGRPLWSVDATASPGFRLEVGSLDERTIRTILRDCALRSAAICVTIAGGASGANAEGEAPAGGPREAAQREALLKRMVATAAEFAIPLFIVSPEPIHDGRLLAGARWVQVETKVPDEPGREMLWSGHLAATPAGDDVDPSAVAARFRLTPGAIREAWRVAAERARLRDPRGAVTQDDLLYGCRSQAHSALSALATRLRGEQSWDDLVLPPDAMAQVREFADRVRYRHKVIREWGFGARSPRGLGHSALFHGASGTGKTLAAEVVASSLGVDAYRVDLASTVSKYVGETSKHLARLFDQAQNSQALIFFDECDAIFGKRVTTKDAHDRYSNTEIDFLLQRLDDFDGLLILATNRPQDLDEAFKRRLGFQIHFPMADAAQRRLIWQVHLPKAAPLADDLDLDFVAQRLAVSGGSIRNIAIGAAFLAAAEGRPIGMLHLMRAARREYDKVGRPCSEAEFGPYFAQIEGRRPH